MSLVLETIPNQGGKTETVIIRRTCIADVREILTLINRFVQRNMMLPRGPMYLYENVPNFIVAEAIDGGTEHGSIIACGSLNILWEDIAEIRSMAIDPEYQGLGLGTKIVRYLVEDARHFGIEKLFTFTVAEDFFTNIGFKRKKDEELPQKVWGECSFCPKYFDCDEVGLLMELH